MAEAAYLSCYKRQFASRQPSRGQKPSDKDNFNANKSSNVRNSALSSKVKVKTLVDAFKQYGMRLCDGARLNAVGKGIHVLGQVPPTASESVTALYLSQNNLRSLDGIEQFKLVRLLSVGGNLLASDKELMRLSELTHLRNLNLMGNPLCNQPNYRLRVISMMDKLQVLDNSDITKKERDAAPHIAAQDDVLRTMVAQNHFDIQKLQRIAQLISLHKMFYGYVMAGVANGQFDRVPSPSDVACNVPLLLRLWRYEDSLSEQELGALKVQMLTIIVRTHAKLAENPKVKAKEYLLKLANGGSPRAQRFHGVSKDIKQRVAPWEEAYDHVIALQQKTIANLHVICEKNRKETVEYLKHLLSMEPGQRGKLIAVRRVERQDVELETKPPPRQNHNQASSWTASRLSESQHSHDESSARTNQYQLPPQQEDPDTWDNRERTFPSFLPPPPPFLMPQGERNKKRDEEDYSHIQEPSKTIRSRKPTLRSGDFANKSLGEAIHGFKLRDSTVGPPKPPRVSFPTKTPNIQSVYTMQRQNGTPVPPELMDNRRRTFQKASRQSLTSFQDDSCETKRSHRDTDAATESIYSQRRVSSAFTRDDLDMTNISAISHASSSPSRVSRGREESYIPIAKSPPPPLTNVQTTRPLHVSQRSQSTQAAPEQIKVLVPQHEGRLQELEQREEKYIRALMQSEQRELDLRNHLASAQRKLASYQRTLAQQLHEREAIKEEVDQRTMAVATPKILKKFFIRWIQFYNWSQQLQHVRRKRCFIIQHDRFWLWRRKVWMQQELRACRRKQQLRIRRLHFFEWLNFTRVGVIAKRNKMLRETRFLNEAFQAWITGVALMKQERKRLQERQDRTVHTLQRACFREWKRTTRYKRALTKTQDQRWRDTRHLHKQVVFWNWKLFLYSVTRPIKERVVQLETRVHCRLIREHFRGWRSMMEIDKMKRFRLRRRIWRRWVAWRRRVQTDKYAAHKERLVVVKIFFRAWRITASEQATSRRSLNLAKRYVNRRRLRKLWLHWKYFSMAKRKYMQDSTKALKHYFIKLLRSSWSVWKERTHVNLQKAKAHKYGALQHHFNAFRTGIRLERAQKARAKMLEHGKKRREWKFLRQVTRAWQEFNLRTKHRKRQAQMLSFQRKQSILNSMWRKWRALYVDKLRRRLQELQNTYDSTLQEKQGLEAHVQAAKDTAVSLTDQIELLHERSKGGDRQVIELEKKLRHCEKKNVSLENELKHARAAIEQERHAWEEALCDEEEKRESDSVKYRSLAHENQTQQVQLIELKRELEAEKNKVAGVEKINEELRAASVTTSNAHHEEMCVEIEKQKALEREIAELRTHLKEQETQREDTANRLYEYEQRIASTCKAMNEHEQAHERENEDLRNERMNIEAKLKEEQAKNEELSRLLQEKNQLILNMTHRMNGVDLRARGGRCDTHPGHEQCDIAHDNQGECGEKNTHTPCRRHPSGKLQNTERDRPGEELPVQLSRKVIELESPGAEEVMIDRHTSRIHEDIRLLQERITKRLDQVPAYAQLPPRLLQRTRPTAPDSPISSCSSLSNDDSSEENQSVADRVRRARLRRLQAQKQSVLLAVSPAVTRLSSRVQTKVNDRENAALLANGSKRKLVRKSKITENRPVSKATEKKRVSKKHQ
ncbi:hypothetical protein DVH05_008120 [Phytophthora capsici]|nr:hypothetical protein DVH05_008120 [Phytophthora capsici]